MKQQTVYIALGGNIGEVTSTFQKAIKKLSLIAHNKEIKLSSLYRTAPVSDIPQPDYLNGCCSFETALSPTDLFDEIERIERELGKLPKPKNAPRIVDIDLLFYGNLSFKVEEPTPLQIPHPRWKERLFVLYPLLDLTETVTLSGKLYSIKAMINSLEQESSYTLQHLSSRIPYEEGS